MHWSNSGYVCLHTVVNAAASCGVGPRGCIVGRVKAQPTNCHFPLAHNACSVHAVNLLRCATFPIVILRLLTSCSTNVKNVII